KRLFDRLLHAHGPLGAFVLRHAGSAVPSCCDTSRARRRPKLKDPAMKKLWYILARKIMSEGDHMRILLAAMALSGFITLPVSAQDSGCSSGPQSQRSDDSIIAACTTAINRIYNTDANKAAAHNNRAQAYERKGMFAQALIDYNTSVKLEPSALHYNN